LHLIKGTQAENLEDKKDNGTHPIGIINPSAILTEEQVLEIRASPLRNFELVPIYGVHKDTISDIRRRKTWKHI